MKILDGPPKPHSSDIFARTGPVDMKSESSKQLPFDQLVATGAASSSLSCKEESEKEEGQTSEAIDLDDSPASLEDFHDDEPISLEMMPEQVSLSQPLLSLNSPYQETLEDINDITLYESDLSYNIRELDGGSHSLTPVDIQYNLSDGTSPRMSSILFTGSIDENIKHANDQTDLIALDGLIASRVSEKTSAYIGHSTPIPPSSMAQTAIRHLVFKLTESPGGKIEFVLSPEELGGVRMAIVKGENYTIKIWVERALTRDLILNNISALKEHLGAAGIDNADISISGEAESFDRSGEGDYEKNETDCMDQVRDDQSSETPQQEVIIYQHVTDGSLYLRV